MPELTVIKTGLAFPEGPRWYDGCLYFSDMYGREVFRYRDGIGVEPVGAVPERPSGLARDANGDLLVSSMLDRRIVRFRDGELETFADLRGLCPGPVNDMVEDGHGGVYVGNFGFDSESPDEVMAPTRLVHVNADGHATQVGDPIMFPNGSVVTDGGATLLVAETFDCRILAFDIADDGSLGNRRNWAVFHEMRTEHDLEEALGSGSILPDGICLDREGALWIADAGGQGAVRVARGGKILDRVPAPEGQAVFAVALGGDQGDTLFLCVGPAMGSADLTATTLGSLVSCRVDVPRA
ncbi:SMP-30/gluconolactonase/LRE family protein [Streptomyces hainanensis]|uniref:Gluconolactonase n=1 Tax=Streptomyces hainanensis TaxID=402648 RepID=A0A4R4TQU0_9ACTN|nr:SMP-30/gluconolactonase/LRE family protein [Streptomyces hainanensis]TDC80511.1 gluconolactonase [Streptomyces hainanensis]